MVPRAYEIIRVQGLELFHCVSAAAARTFITPIDEVCVSARSSVYATSSLSCSYTPHVTRHTSHVTRHIHARLERHPLTPWPASTLCSRLRPAALGCPCDQWRVCPSAARCPICRSRRRRTCEYNVTIMHCSYASRSKSVSQSLFHVPCDMRTRNWRGVGQQHQSYASCVRLQHQAGHAVERSVSVAN